MDSDIENIKEEKISPHFLRIIITYQFGTDNVIVLEKMLCYSQEKFSRFIK